VLFIVVIVFVARVFRAAPLWCWEIVLRSSFFSTKVSRRSARPAAVDHRVVPVARDLEVLLHGTWCRSSRAAQGISGHQRRVGGDAWLALTAALVMAFYFTHNRRGPNIHVCSGITPKLIAFSRIIPTAFIVL